MSALCRIGPAIAAMALTALVACSRQSSAPLGVSIIRNGVQDSQALSQTGLAAGAAALKDVSCSLKTNTAAALPGCAFRLSGGAVVFGPYLPFPPGRYVADFEVETTNDCRGGTVVFDVAAHLDDFKLLTSRTEPVTATRVESIPFTLGSSLADTAPLEFRTSLESGAANCLFLHRVVVRAQ
jgi:hypothetical protein